MEPYELFASHLPTPDAGFNAYVPYAPYEVDVRTERETFINDVSMRRDSLTSTFTSFTSPYLDTPLPAFPADDVFGHDYLGSVPAFMPLDPALVNVDTTQINSLMQSNVEVSNQDRPLLNHFLHHVLRLIFPVLDVHHRGTARIQSIFQALETNPCYLHCCLSVAAIHLKTTEGVLGERIDHDIMRHRYEAISQLCQALSQDENHAEILDATLAMILLNCSVGPTDDYLPDIPWFDHFQAVTNLVDRLGYATTIVDDGRSHPTPPFSMSLASWIDILGATMLGKTPHFAHEYRSRHLSGSSSGFRELMGCDDRVMYLISEIACLDALKAEGRVDSMAVCSHVSALGRQLEYTEPFDQNLEHPYSASTGAIRPEILTKNMTTVFRIAARIYLCSLVPGFDRSQLSNLNLVSAVANALNFIPSGPTGFDRSLVWPLLIAGVFSAPSSHFRTVLAERAASLGEHADLGSFGRMYRLVQEVWRLTDDPAGGSHVPSGRTCLSPLPSPVSKDDRSGSPVSRSSSRGSRSPIVRELKKQQLHWRDVMRRNGWSYLLI